MRSVHDGFRHALSTHASPAPQSAFTVQDWLHDDCLGVGVGVGVGVGLGVGVGVGVTVGVGVGVTTAHLALSHEAPAARQLVSTHSPLEHVLLFGHSEFLLHASPHWAVTSRLNSSLHARAAASGSSSGTVGAIASRWASC